MTIDNARTVTDLIKKLDDLEKQLDNIGNQRDNIGKGKEMIVNCKDDNNFSLNSILVNSHDAKRILQFMFDYFTDEKEAIEKKIEQLK